MPVARFHSLIVLVALLAVSMVTIEARADRSDLNGSVIPKVEIKKFRFRRHNTKNFERLVIEFASKSGTPRPVVRVNPASSGKETNIIIEQVQLVGAIPEALINDSYVPKSKFMGPVSINTDGPTAGFNIRSFLKEPVSVDAFWADGPGRLVLDVFPANSPRTAGRISESDFNRRPASAIKRTPAAALSDKDNILCYPLSAAVSAAVTFQRRDIENQPSVEVFSKPENGPEPVICFFATSAVVATVAFKAKPTDGAQYVQLLDTFNGAPPRQPQSLDLLGGPSLLNPQPPVPAQPQAALPPGTKIPAEVVIPNIEPGRTPLGSPLANPATIQRLPPGMAAPSRLPSFAVGNTPTPPGGLVPPPVATAPVAGAGEDPSKKPSLNPNALLPPTK